MATANEIQELTDALLVSVMRDAVRHIHRVLRKANYFVTADGFQHRMSEVADEFERRLADRDAIQDMSVAVEDDFDPYEREAEDLTGYLYGSCDDCGEPLTHDGCCSWLLNY